MRIAKAVAHLRSDPIMKRVIETHEPPVLPPPVSNFESLASSIVSQQLSVRSAAAIWSRFDALLDRVITPENTLRQSVEDLRGVGLSRPKIEYLHSLAQAFVDDPADYENLSHMSDGEVIEHLTRIKGIGVWTAHMFLIFTLLREDIFPVGDLGIRRAIETLYFEGEKRPHGELTALAEQWQPYRSVASLYLWNSVD